MTRALHERLRFDTETGAVFDATRRYVLLRTDVLMGLFDELGEPAKSDALRAFGRSVARHGADSVRAYVASSGSEALMQTMQDAAASLGWGRWQLVGSDERDDETPSLRLAVENSPFAAAAAPSAGPACHAIAGMLEAIASALWKRPAIAHETRCCAQHGEGACRFVAMPADVAMPPSAFPSLP